MGPVCALAICKGIEHVIKRKSVVRGSRVRSMGATVNDAGARDEFKRLGILFATTLDLGLDNGPTDHFWGVIKQIAASGFDVNVVCPRPSKEPSRLPPENCHFYYCHAASHLGLPNTFSALLALPTLFRLRHLPLLYVRCSAGTLPITLAGRLMGFRRIVAEHNGWLRSEVISHGYWRGFAGLGEWCQIMEAKCASTNRVVTSQIQEALASRGVPQNRIHVIENGTDTDLYYPLNQVECRAHFGIPNDGRPVLAFVGNLWAGAGLETLFEALNLLRARHGDVELLLAGGGSFRQELERTMTRVLGTTNGVRFLGSLPPTKVNLVLGAANIAIAPYSRRHNMASGLSALKLKTYAAAGKATVVSSLPGTVDLGDEPWVFLAEPDSPASLANAIECAMRADLEQLKASARAYAEKNDWSVAAGRIRQLLQYETDFAQN